MQLKAFCNFATVQKSLRLPRTNTLFLLEHLSVKAGEKEKNDKGFTILNIGISSYIFLL